MNIIIHEYKFLKYIYKIKLKNCGGVVAPLHHMQGPSLIITTFMTVAAKKVLKI